ncbi:putative global regulator [Corynebacterium guangdongense]|nr:putative global regulator [Corynebacterium guangdongense]
MADTIVLVTDDTNVGTPDRPDYTSVLLGRPGAAPLDHDGVETAVDARGVAWHYGDPLGEQRAIHDGGVVVDRSHRTVIRVSGKDAAHFLNNLLSQKLDDAPDGFGGSALDLDIQGHILHHADVARVGDDFYLDFPAAQTPTFLRFLQMMIFWSEVTITEVDYGILSVLGDAPIPPGLSPLFLRPVAWASAPRRDLAVPRAELGTAVDTLVDAGFRLAGLMAFTAERVRGLEPELGADLDGKSIPHEVPGFIGRGEHVGAVHLSKGCYRGQETVARVENLGRSPRVLVMLQLDGSAPAAPLPGDRLEFNGRAVGRLGTVVHDCDYGPIALALVKRSALDVGELSVVDADGGRAPVSASVDPDSLPADEGEKAGRAAIAKLRGQQE